MNLSIGILTHNAPNTLHHTLQSYQNNGLLDLTDDILVWIQQSNNAVNEKNVCNSFNIKSNISDVNGRHGTGFKGLVDNAKYEHIILLENDFLLVEARNKTQQILESAMDLISNKDIDCVKLRSRHNPGDPNWGITIRGRELQPEFGSISHLSESIYWDNNPEITYSHYIQKLQDTPLWYTSSSRYCNFTNNPCMYSKDFYKYHIYQFCTYNVDVETMATPWWFTQDFKCAFGEGLFKHARLDGK